MKNIYARLILTIFLTLVLQGIIFSQTCFIQLSDATGIEYTQEQLDSLEAAACELVQTLPSQFQNDFKVYDFGFYRYNADMVGGVEAVWSNTLQNIASNSTYFLAYGKEIDADGSLNKVHIEFNFPTTDYFQCYTPSFKAVISSAIEHPYLVHYNQPLTSSGLYFSQKTSLHNITEALITLSSCCDSGNFTNCENYYNENKIVLSLKSMGFIEINIPSYYITSTSKDYTAINSSINIKLIKESGSKSYSITDNLENWFTISPERLQARVIQINESNKSIIHEYSPLNGSGYVYSEDLVLLDFGQERLFFRIDHDSIPPTTFNNYNQRPAVLPYFAYVVLKRAVMAAGGVAVDIAINIAIEKYVGGYDTWYEAWENTDLSAWELVAAAADGAFADRKMAEFAATAFVVPIEYLVTTPYDQLSWEGFGAKIGKGIAIAAFSTFFGDYVGKFFKCVAKHFNFNKVTKAAFKDDFKDILQGYILNKPGEFLNIRNWVKSWKVAFNRPLLRKDVPFLTKLSEILEPSILNKLPNGQADLDAIVAAIKHPCCGTTHPFMKNVADHLDDIKYLLINFDGVEGFDKVITALKNPNFFAQDGVSHLLTKLKSLDPSTVRKLEGTIVDADNLDGICTNCLFDIEVEVSPGVIKKLELKSYSSETIGNIANNSKFKNQFKAYLADANNMDGFEYIFNGQKTNDLNNIKQNFKTLFQSNNYQIYDDINNVNPGLWNSLGIDDIGDFASMVDNLDPNLYKFIDILN